MLRSFVLKAVYYYLSLHSLLVIPADFEDLLFYVLIEEVYPALQHHIIAPPLPPRLSANEVRKRLLASFLPHGRRYCCIHPRRPALLAAHPTT